jgi:hypothetical protein
MKPPHVLTDGGARLSFLALAVGGQRWNAKLERRGADLFSSWRDAAASGAPGRARPSSAWPCGRRPRAAFHPRRSDSLPPPVPPGAKPCDCTSHGPPMSDGSPPLGPPAAVPRDCTTHGQLISDSPPPLVPLGAVPCGCTSHCQLLSDSPPPLVPPGAVPCDCPHLANQPTTAPRKVAHHMESCT